MTGEENPVRTQVIHAESGTHDSGQLNSGLQDLVSRNGSDFVVGRSGARAPTRGGSLVTIGNDPLSHEEIEAAVLSALAPCARQDYEQTTSRVLITA